MRLKKPEFHGRLKLIVGGERPFTWAHKVGISKGAFDRIWNEGTIPSPELLIRIYKKTHVSITWLLTGEGSMYEKDRDQTEHTPYKYKSSSPTPPAEIQPIIETVIEALTSSIKDTIQTLIENVFVGSRVELQGEVDEIKKEVDAIKKKLFSEPH